MHTLIYAGSLKVIPVEHSSLIGTHSSTVRFLGPSDGRAVPTQPSQRGVNISFSRSRSQKNRRKRKWKTRRRKKEREKKSSTQQISCQRWLGLTEDFFHSASLTRPTFHCFTLAHSCPFSSNSNDSLCSLELQLLRHKKLKKCTASWCALLRILIIIHCIWGEKQHTELFNELPWITGWWDFTLEVTKELNIFIPKWQKLQIAHTLMFSSELKK